MTLPQETDRRGNNGIPFQGRNARQSEKLVPCQTVLRLADTKHAINVRIVFILRA